MSLTLSWRQHAMLEMFMQLGDRQHMRIDEAQTYDQRPFRSMLIRDYIRYRPGHGFRVTQKGMDAWNEFHNTVIVRSASMVTRPLTKYFDPTAYGLDQYGRKAKKASVHVMSSRGAA